MQDASQSPEDALTDPLTSPLKSRPNKACAETCAPITSSRRTKIGCGPPPKLTCETDLLVIVPSGITCAQIPQQECFRFSAATRDMLNPRHRHLFSSMADPLAMMIMPQTSTIVRRSARNAQKEGGGEQRA